MKRTDPQRVLVVLIHGFTGSPARMAAVSAEIYRNAGSDWFEVFTPHLPMSRLSTMSPTRIACDLVEKIDARWKEAERSKHAFDRILIVGHSVGSLIARKTYIIACGSTGDAPFEAEVVSTRPRDWASRVDRMILLAGMNRGWRVSHHLNVFRALNWWLGSVFGRIVELLTGKSLLIFQVHRGAAFVTQLRIQWLRMRQRAARDDVAGKCLTVQLLGSIDDYVSSKDNVDLVAGGDFVYLDVPFSGHRSILEMRDATVPPGQSRTRGALRSEALAAAVTLSPEALRAISVVPDDSDEIPSPNAEVKTVVFVVHGIRDEGYWTSKIARAIRKKMREDAHTVATETSTYGYFPMLPFLFSKSRREKVEWLMDKYATMVATYPNAVRFHFVGHSNGTYCLGEALRLYSCCRFERVVLAGSVLRARYDWSNYLTDGQEGGRSHGAVGSVLNFVATADWVVAIFPKLFQDVPIQRLGGAGHDGFSEQSDRITQIRYVRGSHGAAIAEPVWPAIAEFVADGSVPNLDPALVRPSRNPVVAFLGLIPWLWWMLIGGLLVFVGYEIAPNSSEPFEEVVVRMLLLMAYVLAIFRIVTWF
ncbi:alpha/beta hydrolase [Sphingomonas populi]|uniref:Alpha/beta hydrolase n=1 Tax=Sphingomonas populi TaxID=2484750 RepID=A0A4Q6XS17_9SPHN|nr:alpha/beta hydrolase [Sphingomonas populi]RZF63243.1 alpha/beta hydrolase [Sphingomonas populi]